MKTWLIVIATFLLSLTTSRSDQWHWQDGVIVQKTGNGYLYLFPSTQGKIKGNENPAGVINIGSTITIMYSLNIIGRAKTRFIGMDATRTRGISPQLTVTKAHKAFGFFVRDTNQTTMEIIIQPSFMKKLHKLTEKEARSTIASQGNLNVNLSERRQTVVIRDVTLD